MIFAAGAASGLEDGPTGPEVPAAAGAAGDGRQGRSPTAEPARIGGRRRISRAGRPAHGLTGASDDPAGPGGPTVAPPAGPPTSLRAHRERVRRQRRPVAVVGGLVLSFAVFTLVGSWLLTLLGLPQDLLRWIGLVVLGLVGLGLIVPIVGEWLERPFARLAGGRQRSDAGGFVLGLSLGLVFVPCAGPVLTAIAVVSANHRYGFSSILLTAAFALGIAVPLLVFAVLGQRLAERMSSVRARAAAARKVIGAVLVLTALVIGLNLTDGLQRAVPGYTNALQSHIETNASATQALDGVTGNVVSGGLGLVHPGQPGPPAVRTGPGHLGHQPLAEHARGTDPCPSPG